jgi:hypothetical protein
MSVVASLQSFRGAAPVLAGVDPLASTGSGMWAGLWPPEERLGAVLLGAPYPSDLAPARLARVP